MTNSKTLMKIWKDVTDRMYENPEVIEEFETDISAFCVKELKKAGVVNWTTEDVSCVHLMVDAWVSWQ